MNFVVELNILFVFILIIVAWLRFLRYVLPRSSVSAPEAIGRALGFFLITEIAFSVLVSMVIGWIRKHMDASVLIEILYFLKLIGYLSISVIGALICLKTNENTHTMNVKLYAAAGFVPHFFISSVSFDSGTLFFASIIGVPIASIAGGYFIFKKYPQLFKS